MAAVYLAGAWLVLQVADLTLEAYELPSGSMRALIALLALGFPAALALSWIYRWTPDGVIRESAGDSAGSPPVGRRTVLTVIVLAGLATGVFFVGRATNAPEISAAQAPAGSIAVIPFANTSAGEETDYFSDGLSTELLNLLADVPELRVTGRTSSFFYKGRKLDPRTIGQELNVANILEGEVRKAGNQLRITVSLVDTQTGYQVWSDTYNRELADIFDLQNEIAARTVDGLRGVILEEPPRATPADPAAFDLYLNGSYFYSLRGPENLRKAEEHLLRSIEIDPGFAPAWTTLASAYINMTLTDTLSFEQGADKARGSVEQALQIDPDFAFANSARAWHAMYFERDYALAGAFFNRALELAPGSSTIISNVAVYASVIGQPQVAVDLSREAIARDPISPVSWSNLSGQFNRAGRYSEAIGAAQKALELRPGMLGARVNLCEAYLLSEQPDRALACAESIENRFHELKTRAFAYHALGRDEDALAALSAIADQSGDQSAFEIARIQAWRGDADSAFAWLERAIEEEQNILGLRSEPMFNSIRTDNRWDPLLHRVGLADNQIPPIVR